MQSNILWNFIPNIVLRNAVRNYARNNRRAQNPGLQKRINLIYDKQNLNSLDQEDFDDLETDFMDVGKVHKIHEDEIQALKEKEKFLIVRRKYFKENKINFLTWNDKEQIRYLNHKNPEEWTVEKLSEGFPALPSTITKIINANWKPNSETRKKNHDLHVENNWKLLKEGKLNNLPPQLIEHVIKFTDRKPNINEHLKIVIKPDIRTPGEFGSIIENYNKLVKEKNNVNETLEQKTKEMNNRNITLSESNISNNQHKKDRRLITFQELKNDIENKIDKQKNIDEYDKMILRESMQISKKENIVISTDTTKIGGLQTYKVEPNKELVTTADKKALEASLRYPEKITIPKEKFKKGLTYKINDCYYDYDGEFLYRVPGMY